MNTTRQQDAKSSSPLRLAGRLLYALILLACVLFCTFGFLAAGEPGVAVGWRVAYGVLGLAALVGFLRTMIGLFRCRDGACPVSTRRDNP